jgi:4a-hydroxytetrahydrobiopterin dehydratase
MSVSKRLPPEQISSELEMLNSGPNPGWVLLEGKLHRQFIFSDFMAAMAFMQSVAQEADAMDHHPEWCNVYNRVTVDLVTHSAGGITALDFRLAGKIQSIT